MTTTKADVQDIRRWAETELHNVPCPSDDVLSLLSAGPAARELWHFLVTRVRSEHNARRARSALALAEVPPSTTPDSEALRSELESVQKDIAAAEDEIRQLRDELREDEEHDAVCGTGEDGIREGELRNAFVQALKEVEEQTRGQVDDVLVALEAAAVSETELTSDNDSDDDERQKDNPLAAALKEFADMLAETDCEGDALEVADVSALERRLQEVCSVMPMSRVADALASDSRRSVRRVRSACISSDGPGSLAETAVSAAERLAQDVQLSAYASYSDAVAECSRAEKRVVDEAEQLRDSREARATLLCAQLEGERAVLGCARRETEAERENKEEVSRLTKEVRRGNERTERIDRAMKRLCEGNRRLLEEAVRTRKSTEERVVKELRDMQKQAVEEAEKTLNDVEAMRGKVTDGPLSELMCSGGTGGEDVKCDGVSSAMGLADRLGRTQAWWLRRGEALQREAGQVGVAEGLRVRGELGAEAWEQMVANVEEKLLPRIRAASDEARRCREGEVVYVQDELKNWVRAPAREVAKHMGMLKAELGGGRGGREVVDKG